MSQQESSQNEEAEELKKKHRQQFRDVFSTVEDISIAKAEAAVTEYGMKLQNAIFRMAGQISVTELDIGEPDDDDIKPLYTAIMGLKVMEATTYLDSIKNAIEAFRAEKVKDEKVKYLNIPLLDK